MWLCIDRGLKKCLGLKCDLHWELCFMLGEVSTGGDFDKYLGLCFKLSPVVFVENRMCKYSIAQLTKVKQKRVKMETWLESQRHLNKHLFMYFCIMDFMKNSTEGQTDELQTLVFWFSKQHASFLLHTSVPKIRGTGRGGVSTRVWIQQLFLSSLFIGLSGLTFTKRKTFFNCGECIIVWQ